MGTLPVFTGAQAGGLPVASFAAGGTGLTSFYVIGFELGPWQEYLAQELTPDYMIEDNALPVRVSWLKNSELLIMPDFAADLEPQPESWMNLDFDWQSSGDYFVPGLDSESAFLGTSFQRQYFSPGFEHQFDNNGVLGVSAVIAYQRYSAASLGLRSASTPDSTLWAVPGYSPYEESAYGTGVRLAVRQEVISGFAVDAGFQSRIDMEDFAAFRGVYSQPADLDIPARAHLGLAFQASERSWLNVAVERVLYSEISAFASRNLPNRFLSLLGDSTSPNFNWEDLTVYSVGFAWSNGTDQEWRIDLTTRTQPSPTSQLLNQAIEGDLAKSALVMGYSRRTGERSQVHFNAAYAPSEYAFGGSVLGVTTEDLDQRFELEAMWTLAF
jgi:long-chain fatty acid transport protein